ncbi:MAG: YHS domain-containing protein [Gammaproteobacteria bacterium]|nr:YHS domain-containing protein [Gammaproteobacteria bacterium]
MDGLLSLLIFAGLFYLMMRFGCGSHMVHGHNDKKAVTKHIDPVCGKEVNIEQGYGKMQDGDLYRFCSRECLDKFEENPVKYINLSNEKGDEK